ncbi:hypothetical protein E5Q_06398 [Mixia osmundae IAM 14324]|uniref:non-specific serine/threonine protein kinase n=1 Tax=Mixia osmundae (strain CBS 9802 / IAM 14324 / JCM 22182 / KY 12970) TaxID=764103 RepID=G7EA35_MIXOS|nr:hypothetical protein E5Q_06398 [Mixia osmundae IAM 14324]
MADYSPRPSSSSSSAAHPPRQPRQVSPDQRQHRRGPHRRDERRHRETETGEPRHHHDDGRRTSMSAHSNNVRHRSRSRSPDQHAYKRSRQGYDDIPRQRAAGTPEEGELPEPVEPTGPTEQAHSPMLERQATPPQPQPQSFEEQDPELVLAERRRQRAALLARIASLDASSATPSGQVTPNGPVPSEAGTDSPVASPRGQEVFDLVKDEQDSAPIAQTQTHNDGHQSISAADYNPNDDRMLDDARQLRLERQGVQGHHDTVGQTAAVAAQPAAAAPAQVIQVVADDDDDDMFAVVSKPLAAVDAPTAQPTFIPVIDRSNDPSAAHIVDNFDDPEGYYRVILGELLDDGRYHVHANLGKGMFSSVVKAKDHQADGREMAIKIIRSQESMYKAGQKEAGILRKLQETDPLDKKHIVRLDRTFEHRGHLCLVFESLSMNLREVVKRFGKDVGLNLRAVRAYAHQMLLALSHFRKSNIMHADIKPDNILVNESKAILKICDLGSASDTSENDITPYLVSRFYRAPEIILGLPYDCALDMWSIGCTLYELATGKILYPGRTNNDMLRLHQELRGKITAKLVKKAQFGPMHFDDNGTFLCVENDAIKTLVLPAQPVHDLKSRMMPAGAAKKLRDDERKAMTNFIDLLNRMLDLDSSKRITPKEALLHPFLK